MGADGIKLYRVTITSEVLVIAASQADADALRRSDDWVDILRSDEVRYGAGISARLCTDARGRDLPWHAEGVRGVADASVEQWAERTRIAVERERLDASAQASLDLKVQP